MEIRLKKLSLENFKGIRSFVFEPDGESADIFGNNETGKTTLCDAATWLWNDKDSQGSANFGIKTIADEKPASNIDHAVEGLYLVDGKKLTLKKVYREKWTKKRGSASPEFTGHETLYYVDGDKATKRSYEDRLKEIIDATTARLLTDPRYFSTMPWEQRRGILSTVFGDVSDADVIQADKSLEMIPEIIGDKTAEQVKKNLKSQQTEINKELKEIPARHDELEKSLPEPDDIKKLKHDLADVQQSIVMLVDEKQQIESSDGQAEIKSALATSRTELQTIKTEHDGNIRELTAELKIQKNEKVRMLADLEKRIKAAGQNHAASCLKIDRINKDIDEKAAEWKEVKSESFEYEDDTVCPTCGQLLPQEKVDAARSDAEKTFNQDKSRRLSRIENEGADLKASKDGLLIASTEYYDAIKKDKIEAAAAVKEISDLDEKIKAAESTPLPAAYAEKEKEIADLEAQLEANEKPDTSIIETHIADLKEKESKINRAIAAQEQRISGEIRLKELKSREKELAAEYEDLESQIVSVESFSLKKAIMLQDRINSAFTLASFKMFNQQINGGIDDCCTVTSKDGVEWPDMSNSQQIRVGLDIINVLSDHYGISMPIWIDNSEAATWFPETKAQTIRLNVSAEDKELRIETAKESKAA